MPRADRVAATVTELGVDLVDPAVDEGEGHALPFMYFFSFSFTRS